MTQLSGLAAQVTDLKAAQAAIAADIDKEIQQLSAAVGQLASQPSQAQIDAVAADVKSVVDKLKASSAALKADDPAASPPPAPPVTP